jgi:hypothetical protein
MVATSARQSGHYDEGWTDLPDDTDATDRSQKGHGSAPDGVMICEHPPRWFIFKAVRGLRPTVSVHHLVAGGLYVEFHAKPSLACRLTVLAACAGDAGLVVPHATNDAVPLGI